MSKKAQATCHPESVLMWAVYDGNYIAGAFPSKKQAEKNVAACPLKKLRVVPGTFTESRTGGLFGVSLHDKLYAAYSSRRTAMMYLEVFSGCEDRKVVRGQFKEGKP